MHKANAAPANMARRLPGVRSSCLSPPNAAEIPCPTPLARVARVGLADRDAPARLLDEVAVLRADMELFTLLPDPATSRGGAGSAPCIAAALDGWARARLHHYRFGGYLTRMYNPTPIAARSTTASSGYRWYGRRSVLTCELTPPRLAERLIGQLTGWPTSSVPGGKDQLPVSPRYGPADDGRHSRVVEDESGYEASGSFLRTRFAFFALRADLPHLTLGRGGGVGDPPGGADALVLGSASCA